MTTQVSREMTEQERQDIIEKAAQAAEAFNSNDPDVHHEVIAYRMAEAALEAVGYFDLRAKLDALVEAGEALLFARSRGGSKIVGRADDGHPLNAEGVAARDLRIALNQAKEQSHE